MDSMEDKLMKLIKKMTEIETVELEFLFAKFNKELQENYNEKISIIENNINSQIQYFGKKVEEYSNEKQNIIRRYADEFQKIYNKRKEQYYNIIIEIQEVQSNQKIALVNFLTTVKQMKKAPEKLIDSYDKKLVALVAKYDNYDAIIKECEKKLEECINCSKDDFNKIMKYRSLSLTQENKVNIIISFIKKILGKFFGKSKIQKEVIDKMGDELIDIEKNNNNIIEIINEQTIELIAKIEEARDQINLEFKLSTEQ